MGPPMTRHTAKEFDDALAHVVIPKTMQPERDAAPLIEWDLPANVAEGVALTKEWPECKTGEHGDDSALQLAMRLRDLGISETQRLTIMRYNLSVDDPDEEGWLERISHSADVSGQNAPGSMSALGDFINDPVEPFVVIDADPDKEAADARRRERWRGAPLSELMARPDPVWIISGMIPSGLTFFYAKPKRGKTFFALDVSLSIATGVDFHGEKIGKTGRVLYVAAEGSGKAVAKRVIRMIEKREFTPEQAKAAEQNLMIVEWGIPLNDPASVKVFLAANPGKWTFVVFDTLARNMRGDENSAKDASAVIIGVDNVRRITGADAMVLHHEGRAVGHLRGSTALEGAPDAILRGARDKHDGVIEVLAE